MSMSVALTVWTSFHRLKKSSQCVFAINTHTHMHPAYTPQAHTQTAQEERSYENELNALMHIAHTQGLEKVFNFDALRFAFV